MSDEQAVLTEVRGRVLLITLNRPDQMNAVNTDLAQGLVAAVAELDGNPELTAGVLTGAGRGFCAGMDLKAFAAGGPPEGFNEFLENGARKPLIAAVESFALAGGLEVALTCDLIVAVRTSTFAITPARLGVPYNTSGVNHVLSALPLNMAKELFFTADPMSADEWASFGAVNRLVADADELTETSRQLGRRIASRAPLAVRAIKGEMAALTDARSLTSDDFERLTELRRAAWTSQDYQEGVRAFMEKRSPKFEGR